MNLLVTEKSDFSVGKKHWTSFGFNGSCFEVFDPLGCDEKFIVDTYDLGGNNLQTNETPVMSGKSDPCGFFVIYQSK